MVIKQYENFSWHMIEDEQLLIHEGRQSANCLAFEQCSYRDHAKEQVVNLFFLKDEQNVTHESATYLPRLNIMEDIESYGGSPPEFKHVRFILDLLNTLSPLRIHNIRTKIACYVKVNGVWVNARQFYPGLKVHHSLNLNNFNQLCSLPEDMTVEGDLRLCKTQISQLPEGLNVAGDLDIRYTTIRFLPPSLKVGLNIISHKNQIVH